MALLFEFTKPDKSIGLITRTLQPGPEQLLVERYVQFLRKKLGESSSHFAIFTEPQLASGFPDIVVVRFRPKAFDAWKSERLLLGVLDIKVLFHIHFSGGGTFERLQEALGMSQNQISKSVELLLTSDLLRQRGGFFRTADIKQSFGISSITAIEAKIQDWAGAVEQAQLNLWFASESYILSPNVAPTARIIETARDHGIGILAMPTNGSLEGILHARKLSLPGSYASWQFNEWIGRKIFLSRGIKNDQSLGK